MLAIGAMVVVAREEGHWLVVTGLEDTAPGTVERLRRALGGTVGGSPGRSLSCDTALVCVPDADAAGEALDQDGVRLPGVSAEGQGLSVYRFPRFEPGEQVLACYDGRWWPTGAAGIATGAGRCGPRR